MYFSPVLLPDVTYFMEIISCRVYAAWSLWHKATGKAQSSKLKDQTLSSFHFWIFGKVQSQTCYFCHTSARPVDQNIWALLVIKLPMIGSTSRVWSPLVIDLRLQSALGLVSVRCHQTHHTTTDRCRQRHVKLSNPYPLINRESECLWTFPNKAYQCSKNHITQWWENVIKHYFWKEVELAKENKIMHINMQEHHKKAIW